MHVSSQASRNKDVSVSSISHVCPGARALGESVVLENVQFIRILPGHFLDVNYCAGKLQRNHELLDLYKENIHYLSYKLCEAGV